eukprot:TRINITY_DN2108_c0_g1_i1.p1 TRINITY_DN2108_c0_g1~~TRINITY_DN2108_c0_g1_i1.p1  ORF type:complete len:237 (-),score=34.60 TRINITY_DN2108_c0_g1_i1:138-848(-)
MGGAQTEDDSDSGKKQVRTAAVLGDVWNDMTSMDSPMSLTSLLSRIHSVTAKQRPRLLAAVANEIQNLPSRLRRAPVWQTVLVSLVAAVGVPVAASAFFFIASFVLGVFSFLLFTVLLVVLAAALISSVFLVLWGIFFAGLSCGLFVFLSVACVTVLVTSVLTAGLALTIWMSWLLLTVSGKILRHAAAETGLPLGRFQSAAQEKGASSVSVEDHSMQNGETDETFEHRDNPTKVS